MVVKTRKVGNSTTLTVPSSFAIPSDVEYEVEQDSNGNLLFKRVDQLSSEEKLEIDGFMDQFQTLMEKLKDK
jgi:antitoxin component of MazEF toxin-antitoxin module